MRSAKMVEFVTCHYDWRPDRRLDARSDGFLVFGFWRRFRDSEAVLFKKLYCGCNFFAVFLFHVL